MLEKYKNLIGEVETILGILDDETRRYDYKRIHCINVKRHNGCIDDYSVNIDKLIENYDLETQKKIKDKFNDDYINDVYDNFIYYIASSFMCRLQREVGDLANEFGFYGRSGGWFGYEVIHLENYAYDLIDNFNNYLEEDEIDIKDIKYEIDDIYNFIDLYNKYNNILIKAKEYNESVTLKDELEYQIKEYVKELKI